MHLHREARASRGMWAGRGGEGVMADKARAASAYRTAHARGAVGREGVALVRTAPRARAAVVVAGGEGGELRRGQWCAGNVGVVVCATALPGAVGLIPTKQEKSRERQAGEEGCGEPLQLVLGQVELAEPRKGIKDARRQRLQFVVAQLEGLDPREAIKDTRRQPGQLVPVQPEARCTAHIVKHAWRQRCDALVVEIQPARLVGALARAMQRAIARLAEDAPAPAARQTAMPTTRWGHSTRRCPAVGVLSARARGARSTARLALVLAGLARGARRSVAARIPLRDCPRPSGWRVCACMHVCICILGEVRHRYR